MNHCKCGCGNIIAITATWARGHHRIGKGHSQASREKIRKAAMGRPSATRGKKRTEAEKLNMKAGISKEERNKRSERMKKRWADGKCDIFKGQTNPSKRPEVSKKIGDANRVREVTDVTREKIRKARTGKPGPVVSERTKKMHSDRMKVNNPMFRKDVLDKHPLFKSGIYFTSEGEKKLSIIFKEEGYIFRHQEKIKKEKGYYIADFFFPMRRKLIEFDGHSRHADFPDSDIRRDRYIWENYGYGTLRILPPDLNLRSRKELLTKIGEFLDADN